MLLKLKQAIYRLLALGAIRPPAAALMNILQSNPVPAVGPAPAASTVLVLAPHMDDETIGCGGVIQSHLRNGASVHVIFLTDGSRGFEREEISTLPQSRRRDIRVAESEAACAVLGVTATHYLDLPDGSSQADANAVSALLAIIDTVAPDLLYLPFFTDTHHDHRTCNALFAAACAQRSSMSRLLCCCYEVWVPLYPNLIVDVTSAMDTKLEALACYTSQLQMNNYLSSVQGLNAYRAIANRSNGYAEAFYVTSAAQYLKLLETSEAKNP